MMFLGNKTSAIEAKQMGMIYETVADEQLMQVVLDFAKKLSKRPTKGLGLTKKALNKSFTNSLPEQLGIEKELQGIAAKTHDHQEGIKAFFEKRRPNYTGE
jgi:2-(1,2-epoxy-1,2-dihydrophenyl)acetyl-CoA isomerase